MHDCVFDKILLFKHIIEEKTLFESYNSIMDKKGKNTITDKIAFKNGLMMEIHFKMLHSLENLFLLIFAMIENPEDIWSCIKNMNTRELNRKIRKVAREGLDPLYGEKDFKIIKKIVFLRCPDNFLESEFVIKNLEKIDSFFKKAAKELLNRKEEYNSFKHGARVLRFNLSASQISKKDNSISALWDSTAVAFLGENNEIVSRCYDYKRDFEISEVTWAIIRIAIEQRKNEKMDKIKIMDFRKKDIDKMFEVNFPLEDIRLVPLSEKDETKT